MLFNIADVVLIIALMIFTVGGFVAGLIGSIGAILGMIAGFWTAGHYYQWLAEKARPLFLGHEGAAKIVAFLAIFILIDRLISLIFWFIGRFLKILSLIPFMGSINRFAGAVLGFIEGILAIGVAVFLTVKFLPEGNWLIIQLNGSGVAHFFVWATSIITSWLSAVI